MLSLEHELSLKHELSFDSALQTWFINVHAIQFFASSITSQADRAETSMFEWWINYQNAESEESVYKLLKTRSSSDQRSSMHSCSTHLSCSCSACLSSFMRS